MSEIKPFTKSYAINRIAELIQENKQLRNNIELMTKYNNENIDDVIRYRKALEEIREISQCRFVSDLSEEADAYNIDMERITTKINEVLKEEE